MNEKAKYLLDTTKRKALEKGMQYNSPLEERNEYIVILQHIYVEMLEQIVSYYQQEAIKTSNEMSRGLNND